MPDTEQARLQRIDCKNQELYESALHKSAQQLLHNASSWRPLALARPWSAQMDITVLQRPIVYMTDAQQAS